MFNSRFSSKLNIDINIEVLNEDYGNLKRQNLLFSKTTSLRFFYLFTSYGNQIVFEQNSMDILKHNILNETI